MHALVYGFESENDRTMFLESAKELPQFPLVKHTAYEQVEPKFALFVSGKQIVDGPQSTLNVRFDQEVASHSGSVEIRKYDLGKWTVVRSRRFQSASRVG